MKRFVVLVEFQDPDNQDEIAQEPVKDFDTFDEATDFISQQHNPDSYVIEDMQGDEEEQMSTIPPDFNLISDRDTGDEILYPEDYLDEDMADDDFFDRGRDIYH